MELIVNSFAEFGMIQDRWTLDGISFIIQQPLRLPIDSELTVPHKLFALIQHSHITRLVRMGICLVYLWKAKISFKCVTYREHGKLTNCFFCLSSSMCVYKPE